MRHTNVKSFCLIVSAARHLAENTLWSARVQPSKQSTTKTINPSVEYFREKRFAAITKSDILSKIEIVTLVKMVSTPQVLLDTFINNNKNTLCINPKSINCHLSGLSCFAADSFLGATTSLCLALLIADVLALRRIVCLTAAIYVIF